MRCHVCGKPLGDGLDTFGDVGLEMCWDCWSTLNWEDGVIQIIGQVKTYPDGTSPEMDQAIDDAKGLIP